MSRAVDTAWERAGWVGEESEHTDPFLDVCRWTFAYLPDAKMKSVAAGWMTRVMLGADPAEMNEEELQIVAVSSIMAARSTHEFGVRWDA
jgi:hypothetical protein